MNNGITSLAKLGRNGDTELAHLMVGEVILPPGLLSSDKKLKASLEKKLAGYDSNIQERTVGSDMVSFNPKTGLAEFGFLSKLWKKVKKVVDPVTKVAQYIPGPWRAPAALYQKGKAALNIAKGDGNIGDILAITGGPKLFGKEGVTKDFFKNFSKEGFKFGEYGDAFKSAVGNIGEYVLPGEDKKGLFKNLIEGNKVFATPTTPNKYVGPDSEGGTIEIDQATYDALPDSLKENYQAVASTQSEGLGSFFGRRTPDFIRGIEDEFKRSFDPKQGGIDPRLVGMAALYAKQVEKAAEREAKGATDVRDAFRPDLALPSVYGGGIGGFDLGLTGYAEGGAVMDMRAGGESAGPGTGTSDDIPAMLSDGEFVMTAKAVRNAGSFDVAPGDGGIMQLMPTGKPSREKGSDNMMTLMKYFEGVA
tara:strand:+ start:772 stop:2031 length:1260 start_codon:yes stop_codon:yes gene_type:complete